MRASFRESVLAWLEHVLTCGDLCNTTQAAPNLFGSRSEALSEEGSLWLSHESSTMGGNHFSPLCSPSASPTASYVDISALDSGGFGSYDQTRGSMEHLISTEAGANIRISVQGQPLT